jgi:hypothetical protein
VVSVKVRENCVFLSREVLRPLTNEALMEMRQQKSGMRVNRLLLDVEACVQKAGDFGRNLLCLVVGRLVMSVVGRRNPSRALSCQGFLHASQSGPLTVKAITPKTSPAL